MTDLLLQMFVRNSRSTDDPKVRTAVGTLSGVVGIICNFLLAVGKLFVGVIAASVSITADALNNLSDAGSSVMTLIGFRLAELPPDKNHPYGHARFEYLTGLGVAAVILLIGAELVKSSVSRILHPAPVEFSVAIAVVLIGSILVKLWLAAFNKKLGKVIDSAALAAAAADSRNDCISTAAVLIAAIVGKLTHLDVDGYIGLAVAVFILYSGVELAKDTISPLLGEAASPELQQHIVDYISSNPKVLGYHDLMVHDYGPGQRFASIHVEMDKNEDPLECHEMIDDMERECFQSHGVHLVIHHDPVVTDDPELDKMRNLVLTLLRVRDSRLSIHDFRMVPGEGHTNLIFDVVLPCDMQGQEEDIKKSLEAALNSLGERTYYVVITFDSQNFN